MPTPKIDDQYWFDYSVTLVSKAVDAIDQAAGRIQTFSLWLWGIYTTLAAVGFALAGKELAPLATALIASTSVVIIAVYWSTVWVQAPAMARFDARSPKQIRNAYADIVKKKSLRLKITQVISAVAAAMVGISLTTASLSGKPQVNDPDFIASVGTQNGLSVVSLTTKIKTAERVFLSLEVLGKTNYLEITNMLLLPTKPDGIIQTCIETTNQARNYRISLEWTNTVGNTINVKKAVSVP